MVKALNKKNTFLLDSVGALLSTLMLGLALPSINELIGLPLNTFYLLASFPFCFMFYSFICYIKYESTKPKHMLFISLLNFMYCLISIFVLTRHFSKLSLLGLSYFFAELIIVGLIAGFELKLASQSD